MITYQGHHTPGMSQTSGVAVMSGAHVLCVKPPSCSIAFSSSFATECLQQCEAWGTNTTQNQCCWAEALCKSSTIETPNQFLMESRALWVTDDTSASCCCWAVRWMNSHGSLAERNESAFTGSSPVWEAASSAVAIHRVLNINHCFQSIIFSCELLCCLSGALSLALCSAVWWKMRRGSQAT